MHFSLFSMLTLHLCLVELRGATPVASTPRPSRNEADEDDEPPLNEDDDDDDELDDFDQEDNETNTQHLVLALFEKVNACCNFNYCLFHLITTGLYR